jgi:hypothetical protein
VRIGALGWALQSTAGSQPVGVDFVPGGIQFRAPSTGVAKVAVPATDPPIVEIEWASGGSVQRRLAQAGAGTLVPLDGEPKTVTITTLAGDQYRITSTQGTNAPAAPAVFPDAGLLAACVQLEPLGRGDPMCVAFAVDATLLVSVADHVASFPIVGVHGDARQAEVIRPRQGDEPPSVLIGLKAIGPASVVAEFATTFPLDAGSSEILRAAAAGFDAGAPRWYDVALEPIGDEPAAIRRGVLFNTGPLDSRALTAAFAGAPLVAGGSVVGTIVRIAPPSPQEMYASIEFVGATYVKEVVERAQRAIRPIPPPSERPFVFISYATEDRNAAERIREELEKLGLDVYQHRNLLPGSDWSHEIERVIDSSAVFVAILSKHALVEEERYFRREWRMAEQRWRRLPRTSRFVLPIVVDDLSPSDERVPEFFRQFQWGSAPGGEPDRAVLESIASEYRRALVATRRDIDEPSVPADLFGLLLPDPARRAVDALMRMQIGRTEPVVLIVNGSRQSPLDELDWAVEQARPPGLERVAIRLLVEHVDMGATELAMQIASSAGVSVDDLRGLSEGGPRRLVQGVLSALDRKPGDRLVTIDGLEDVTRGDLIEFVRELTRTVTTRSKSRVKLMLFGFDRPTPPDVESRVSRVRLEDVSRSDVVRLLVALLERTGKRNDAELLAQKATEAIFSSLRDEWRYGDLRKRVEQMARQLIEDGPTQA